MAWRCGGKTNNELIDNLRRNDLITSDRVADAMRNVDRRNYVPERGMAYDDSPQQIGFGATISAPHMHAHACENLLPLLDIAERDRGAVLDVGSGSGYLTAVLHHLAPNARVIGIDHLLGLVQLGKDNLTKDGVNCGDANEQAPGSGPGPGPGEIKIVLGDGRKGYPPCAPYQVIHVGAAAPTLPQDLVDQLASPGRMFIPVGDYSQDIWQVDKSTDGTVTEQKLFGVRYVPLTDATKQWCE